MKALLLAVLLATPVGGAAEVEETVVVPKAQLEAFREGYTMAQARVAMLEAQIEKLNGVARLCWVSRPHSSSY